MEQSPSTTTPGQVWAAVIRDGAHGANDVIAAVNQATADRRANRGGVMAASAYLLAQSIVDAGPDDAAEIRAGIMALVDGYATQLAMSVQP